MQTTWRGIMRILKDHMSYVLVPEMKESTDMAAAYTLRFINHLPKCCGIQNKNSAFQCRKLDMTSLFAMRGNQVLSYIVSCFNTPKEN